MATWHGVKGICHPCRELLVDDKPFNCEKGPDSTNWICQTCHENGDESIVEKGVIKLGNCTFPIQARQIPKETKEAWRLFTTVSPRGCRRSAGGHLAAARNQKEQDHQLDTASSPLESTGNGREKSLTASLSVGKSLNGGSEDVENSVMFPNLLRNTQEWSITPNRPPTPPESDADNQDGTNESAEVSQPQDAHNQRPDQSHGFSKRPSEVGDSHFKENTLVGDGGNVMSTTSTTKKKRRLHRGLKDTPQSPSLPPSKKPKPDLLFYTNEELMDKWTNTAKWRASESVDVAENGSAKGANPPRGSTSLQKDMGDRPGLHSSSSTPPGEALLEPAYPSFVKAKRNLQKKLPMGLDGTVGDVPSSEVDQTMALHSPLGASLMSTGQQRGDVESRMLAGEVSTGSNAGNPVAVESINEQPSSKRAVSGLGRSTSDSGTKEPLRTRMFQKNPIHNEGSARVGEAPREAEVLNLSPPHAWSRSTLASGDSVYGLHDNQPAIDQSHQESQRGCLEGVVSSAAPDVPNNMNMNSPREQNFPHRTTVTEDVDCTMTDDHEPQQSPGAVDRSIAYQQSLSSSAFNNTSKPPQVASEAEKPSSTSGSKVSDQVIADSDMQICQSESPHLPSNNAAATNPRRKIMPSDYIEDMLAAAKATKESSLSTEPSFNVQFCPINAPANKQGGTTGTLSTPQARQAPEKKARKRRAKASEPLTLPKLAPAPFAKATCSSDGRQVGKQTSDNTTSRATLGTPTQMTTEPAPPNSATDRPSLSSITDTAPEAIRNEDLSTSRVGSNTQPGCGGTRTSRRLREPETCSNLRPCSRDEGTDPPVRAEGGSSGGVGSAPPNSGSLATSPQAQPSYPWLNLPQQELEPEPEPAPSSQRFPLPTSLQHEEEPQRITPSLPASSSPNVQVEQVTSPRQITEQRPPLPPSVMANVHGQSGPHTYPSQELPSLGHSEIFTSHSPPAPREPSRRLPEPYLNALEAPSATSEIPQMQAPNTSAHPRYHHGLNPQGEPMSNPQRSSSHPMANNAHALASVASGPATTPNGQLPSAYAFPNQNSASFQPFQHVNPAPTYQRLTDTCAVDAQRREHRSPQTLVPIATFPSPFRALPAMHINHEVQFASHRRPPAGSVPAGPPPGYAISPATHYPPPIPLPNPPHHDPGYNDRLARHLHHTKLRINLERSADTVIVRLGDCTTTDLFIMKIMAAMGLPRNTIRMLRITFDWIPEWKRGRTMLMTPYDRADAFGHIYDEIHTRFRMTGYSVSIIDVELWQKT
ncbi:MAG: hypothetical protein Q9163_005532 [Psora crenata]